MTIGALGAIAQQQAPNGLMPQRAPRPNPVNPAGTPPGGMHPVAEQQQKFGAFKGLGETLKGFATSPEGRVFMMGTLASLASGDGIASPLAGVGTLAKFKHMQRQRSDEEAKRAEEQRRYEHEQQTAAEQRRNELQIQQRRLTQGDRGLDQADADRELAAQRENRLGTGQAEDRAFQREQAAKRMEMAEKEYQLRVREVDAKLAGKGEKPPSVGTKLDAINDALNTAMEAINSARLTGANDAEVAILQKEAEEYRARQKALLQEHVGGFGGGAPTGAPQEQVSEREMQMIQGILSPEVGGFAKAKSMAAGSPERLKMIERLEAIANSQGML